MDFISIFIITAIIAVTISSIFFYLERKIEKNMAKVLRERIQEKSSDKKEANKSPSPKNWLETFDSSLDFKNFLQRSQIKDFMSTNIVTINVNSPFSLVPEKLQHFRIRHLPIVDEHNKLVGLMTERDLYKIISPRKLDTGEWYYDKEALNKVILKHVMNINLSTLTPENSLGEALVTMAESKYGSIPIIDENGILKGIITRQDILEITAQIYMQ